MADDEKTEKPSDKVRVRVPREKPAEEPKPVTPQVTEKTRTEIEQEVGRARLKEHAERIAARAEEPKAE